MHSIASELKPRWYLGLMRPHPNGDWILLRDLYTDARAFNDLLNDLSEPFRSDDTDLVAGPEAMGPPTLLLVDQWIETGGSTQASIDVLTRQGAVIAGIATLGTVRNSVREAGFVTD